MSQNSACPPNAPVELPDGKIVMPDDQITLSDLCDLLPLLLETMGGGASGANGGKIAPGSQVPIAGAPMPFGTPAIPSNRSPFGGQGSLTAGGGGGGFPAGGGGGRGKPGPPGPPGVAGPGQIVPVIKTDGNLTIASVSPFVMIPGTSKTFVVSEDGPAVFMIQAVFGGNTVSGLSNGQIGLRVDGTDYPLTANLIHTTVVGVGQFLASAQAAFPVQLSKGSHTASLIVRGDSSLGAPTGSPLTVQANPTIPLAMTIIHK
jgi:hypothetical protein